MHTRHTLFAHATRFVFMTQACARRCCCKLRVRAHVDAVAGRQDASGEQARARVAGVRGRKHGAPRANLQGVDLIDGGQAHAMVAALHADFLDRERLPRLPVLDLPHDPKRALAQLGDLFVFVCHFLRRAASAARGLLSRFAPLPSGAHASNQQATLNDGSSRSRRR
jgi:hypothetical protein